MTLPTTLPLLAIDPGTIIGMVVIILTLLGWLMNYASSQSGKQPAGPRPGQQPRPGQRRDDRLQTEIDIFLEEVRGGRRRLGEDQPVPIEVVEEPPQRRRVAAEPEFPVPAPASAETSRVETRVGRTPQIGSGGRAGKRIKVGATPVGGRIRLGAKSGKIESHARQMGQHVGEDVQLHLGAFSGASPGPIGAPAAADTPTSASRRMLEILRTRDGMKQAILIHEILSRPKTLGPQ